MRTIPAYVIGIRIDPDRAEPEWYTLWFEDEEGSNRVVTKGGRMQWAPRIDGALALGVHFDEQVQIDRPDLDGVCDIARTFFEISHLSTGHEALVLTALNLLDDMLDAVGHPLPTEAKLRLDQVVTRLTEGESVPEAVLAHGGAAPVVEAVLASLGRVLVWSDFVCDVATSSPDTTA